MNICNSIMGDEYLAKCKRLIKSLYNDLIKNNKKIDNYALAKIFEYYTSIKLSEEKGSTYYVYDAVPISYKEKNSMSLIDTGIDLCNLNDTIVQCKLRSKDNKLSLGDCSTFFSSQADTDENTHEAFIRWRI